MFKFLILITGLCGVFCEHSQIQSQPEVLVPVHIHHTHKLHDDSHAHGHEDPHAAVTPEYLKAFRCFSRNLLQQPNYYEAYEKTGAVSYFTFAVGHLLANVLEQVYSVRTAGIVKALGLPRENITNAYSAILDSFLEDPIVKPSSTLYASSANVVLGQNFQKLHTVADVLPLHENPKASAYINRQVAANTQQLIIDRLVPQGPFNSSAAGAFVNTFYYKNTFQVPFISIGEKVFYTPDKEIQVKTLESSGSFPYYENENYSAIAIPLTGGRKHIVFVRPKNNIQEYLSTSVQDIFKSDPTTWYKRLVRVQVPYLHLVLGRNYQAQLDALGGTKTSCCGRPDTPEEVIDPATRHYIQPVVEVLSSRISAEGFELAVTNGAQVNRKVPSSEVPIPPTQEVKSEDVNKPDDIELVVSSGKYSRQGRDAGVTDFLVNNPFFVYLHDNALGAVSFTAVRSVFDVSQDSIVPQSRNHVVDISTDFSEEAIAHRWSCDHHHHT